MSYFVSMTDKFMSGWGGAQSRKAKYVVECDTLEQARHIERAANQRDEMIHVHLTAKPPRFYPKRRYQVSHKQWSDLGGVWKDGWQG